MAFSVQMPALGESVTEGTVTRWLKQEGDRVEVDEPLLEVSTDKVDTEIPSPAAGVLQRIVAGEDETVEVGGELAVIGDGEESGDSGASGGDEPAEPAAEEEPAQEEAPREEAPAEEPAPAQEEPAPQAATKSTGSGTAITMPELGESVTEGTVTRWLKEVGDSVEVDEPLLEVSTDKVDTEIPSPVAGTLLEITAGEDETVEVGGQLAVIGDGSAAQAEEEPAPEKEPEPEKEKEPEPEPAPKAQEKAPEPAPKAQEKAERADVAAEQPSRPESDGAADAPTGAPYVTPLVRKLAAEHGVDLSTITGSGVGGRIRKQDVLAAAEAAAPEPTPEPAAAPAAASAPAAPQAAAPRSIPRPAKGAPEPGTTVKLPRLRQVIAQRMTESLRVSAQLTTVQEVDVTRIAKLRARAKAEFERREGVKLTYLPFFAKAVVEALKAFPQVNASINDETNEVTYHGNVHLAIAVDTPRGLLVPVIKNAEDLNIAGLARRIADVAARTRDNKIGPDELSGGTFTITNIGSAGALFDTPIINQPQVAILGTGVITKQPMVVTGADGDDVIAVRSVCYLPLTYDHRLVDGADAGRFVSAVKARLEEGAFEADLGL
ncbi:dihydrolipoamide acetyltransferase component of pyruvate dehydrogenase complex [Pseudonocardia hydrocarbonoxydans]|uniref:Dihydrolipoamide acetyltransferase component of pyruvate dehydrogenase complex n=1 Tax=Pseudonocardia hydrocarbonoxydans TaxID=76726 RepID=A0A4Y3WT23_9PSEU|nr:2-oxoglutarate dehydrogenase, E2 component, dihydrolipoamide succinyltransferase [Pseudonocardia hydrocarbonoxydans]GEC21668.1 dihydrolipoamide acetyltransferase component of pyruvate dehydrogenase complex [Pseudonocardia hydrocarbonoxydans]